MDGAATPRVDRDACAGHGRCYLAAPETFDCDDEGFPVVIGSASTASQRSALDRAMRNCPEHAISVTPANS